jgi:hypothetical protein
MPTSVPGVGVMGFETTAGGMIASVEGGATGLWVVATVTVDCVGFFEGIVSGTKLVVGAFCVVASIFGG